ncbi:hypothetical protein CAPTEDRAFT_186059 [Capitella teleta]|uniref:Uncharacterized protein n=1 Tax=Capitella teleta TaxID=283909 RepID=R7ULG1_CAPTE|nr:hypothetical protein CAPTEDRAFT_186059 [Capitella teleta]|eukprot:ELU04772.1 hypothetical protein CAPTEDRAFT_186059 [Capitella teleta]
MWISQGAAKLQRFEVRDSDLVLLHSLYFLTYSFWKSYIPLGITILVKWLLFDAREKASGRMQEWSLTSILQLSQLEEETVDQVLTSIESSSPAHPPKLSFVQMVGGHTHADGNSKRSVKRKTSVHQSKTEINFFSTNELCADLTFVSGLCMFSRTIKL